MADRIYSQVGRIGMADTHDITDRWEPSILTLTLVSCSVLSGCLCACSPVGVVIALILPSYELSNSTHLHQVIALPAAFICGLVAFLFGALGVVRIFRSRTERFRLTAICVLVSVAVMNWAGLLWWLLAAMGGGPPV